MNVYQKLANARLKLKEAGLKQSGKNKGVGYSYFDLSDILPLTTKLEQELGLLSVVSFTEMEGKLTIYNTEQASESITFTSPIRDAELRGCHPVQNLGAIETYVRRYLYLLAYEIVETDVLDMTQANDKKVTKQQDEKKQMPIKSQKLYDLIKDTKINAREVPKWITANFGSQKFVDDLTDEEFEKLYSYFKTMKENLK